MRIETHFPARTALLVAGLMLGVAALAGCNRHDNDAQRQVHVDGNDIGNRGVSFKGEELTLRREGLPTAVITPAGDLQLDGKTVTTTAAQRQAMTGYRVALQAVVGQGIAVGKAGAELGVNAAGEAIKGLFNGDTDKIGEKVEAQADKIKAEALKLCDHIELLRVAQDTAVAQVPQFKPYSQIDKGDVNDCRKQ